ncbi:larval cuticle protein LCP-17-like [Anthonomus grandis grandis]|uniref:larval cuticle protein LCP-17-like n=1 Tax=Anthonomus grandis grandis TaxID=2921223 RepID=UPI0021650E90|nr:larval cuticle protein LCP-17-like [Anthonomus grandis grandis]
MYHSSRFASIVQFCQKSIFKMMKLVVFSALLAAAVAGPVGGDPKSAQIVKSESDISPEGSYQFAYETDNGISAQEQGSIQVQGPEQASKSVNGQFQFLTPENENIQISYVADENGYQPSGNALPTPPPIPAAIQRALEYIAAHPQQPEGPQQPARRF